MVTEFIKWTVTTFHSVIYWIIFRVWSAVGLKYNPYLLYIAFWFANPLQKYESTAVKQISLELRTKKTKAMKQIEENLNESNLFIKL